MCGICGFTGTSDRKLLRAMTDSLFHRGPDDHGYYEDADVSLGVRRLNIIDISGGHQPMMNEEGSVLVVFNGEIYNFHDLRHELASEGHDFSTNSDTETIVHAYEQYDVQFVNRLSGMFAIAIWDQRKRRLVLARDRIGMKPLYYTNSSGALAFASEIKALLVRPDALRVPNNAVLRLILAFGYSPDERTPFEGIFKLLPGHMMIWENGKSSVHRYWDVPLCSSFLSNESWIIPALRHILEDAVRSHLVSDVPVGVMLSGGIDSATIASLAKDVAGDGLQTFTFVYSDEPDAADTRYAAETANWLSSEHREIVLDSADFLKLLPLVIYHHDEPKVDAASLPTLATAFGIKRQATVVLVGEGSDEQLGGYDSHTHFAKTRAFQALAPRYLGSDRVLNAIDSLPSLRSQLRAVMYFGFLRDRNHALRILNSPVFTDWEFATSRSSSFADSASGTEPSDVYEPLLREVAGRDSAAPIRIDLKVYIPNDISMKIDKMTMAASLEARMPFLDNALLDLAPRIDPFLKKKGGTTKYLLRKAIADKLPRQILKRPKQGIRVPVAGWIRNHIDTFDQITESAVHAGRSPVTPEAQKRLVGRARGGTDLHAAHQLLALSVLETWHRMYIDPDPWQAQTPPRANMWPL